MLIITQTVLIIFDYPFFYQIFFLDFLVFVEKSHAARVTDSR